MHLGALSLTEINLGKATIAAIFVKKNAMVQ